MFKFIVLCALIAFAVADEHEDAHADVKHYSSEVDKHGFKYAFETTNHIAASASGDEHGNVHGEFSWVDPKGEHVAVQYVADEYGYQPKSDALPVPPPVPVEILKSLEYIAAHPSHDEHF